MHHIKISSLLALMLLCAACSSVPTLKPYRMDIQQGNVVTSKMMLQLRPGMSKSQVRFVMGTPLIQDLFHIDRWDYFYQMRKDGKIVEQRRVILEFDKDALLRVRGDVVPAGSGQDLAEPSTGTAPTSQPEQKKSLLDRLEFWKSNPADVEKPQVAPADLITPQIDKAPANVTPAAATKLPLRPAPATQPVEPVQVAPKPPIVEPEAAPVVPAPTASQPPVSQPVATAPATPVQNAAVPASSAGTPEAKPTADKENDLPPEGEPGYFERLLQKIGF